MTQVPTTTIDSLRAIAVTGNGFRGDNTAAAKLSGDFLQSLLAFSPPSTAWAATADMRFDQLVGALQVSRPAWADNRLPTPGPTDREQSPGTRRSDEEEDSRESQSNDLGGRRLGDDPAAMLAWPGELLSASTNSSAVLAQSDMLGRDGQTAGDITDRQDFANQRSAGFPTAERVAAMEAARQASLGSANESSAGNGALLTSERLQSGAVAQEGGFALDGRWQRVVGEETLTVGPGRSSTPSSLAGDPSAANDLRRPGQLDAVPALEGSVGESDQPQEGWQLSFQSDRAGVRTGRSNSGATGAKAKARSGILPDGNGPVDRAYRLSPPNASTLAARHEGVLGSPVPRAGGRFSLDELALVPAAARALSESGLGSAQAPLTAGLASVAAEILSGAPVPTGTGSVSPVSTVSPPESTGLSGSVSTVDVANTEVAVGSVSSRGEIAAGVDVDGSVPEVAGGSRTVPTRLLNQVAQAMRQAPVGDSTLRLQLNPVDLGQLSIEIAFRDGVMHGKLRAEQGQTLKWLQEGMEGLKARLSDQGIVVQTLEVELGQQGDFSQHSGSFSPGPDSGRPRSGRGFFSPDDTSRRTPKRQPDSAIQPTPRDTSGQWAVNVIV